MTSLATSRKIPHVICLGVSGARSGASLGRPSSASLQILHQHSTDTFTMAFAWKASGLT